MTYWLVRGFCRLMLRIIYRWRIADPERVPVSGGVIVCANHFDWRDSVVVGCSLSRKVHFMAKHELFRLSLTDAFMRRLGAFPVRRGRADRKALRDAMSVLHRGGVLGMFPEGTRSVNRELQSAQLGAGLLAVWSGCPVLPVAIKSSYGLFQPVEVRIGELITPDADYSDREAPRRVMTAVMAAISGLLAEPGE